MQYSPGEDRMPLLPFVLGGFVILSLIAVLPSPNLSGAKQGDEDDS